MKQLPLGAPEGLLELEMTEKVGVRMNREDKQLPLRKNTQVCWVCE